MQVAGVVNSGGRSLRPTGDSRRSPVYHTGAERQPLGTHCGVTQRIVRVCLRPLKLVYLIVGIAPIPHPWTDFDHLYVILPRMHGSAFWVALILLPILVSNPQKHPFRGMNRHFKA